MEKIYIGEKRAIQMNKNLEELEKQGIIHIVDADRCRDYFYTLFDVLYETTASYFDNSLYGINVEDIVYGRIIDFYSEELLCFHDKDDEDQEYTSRKLREIFYVWSCFRKLISVIEEDGNARFDNEIRRIQNKAKFKKKIIFEHNQPLWHYLNSLDEAFMLFTVNGLYLENKIVYDACLFVLNDFVVKTTKLAEQYVQNSEYLVLSFSGMEEKKTTDEYAYIKRCVDSLNKNIKECVPLAKEYISELVPNTDTYKGCTGFMRKLEGVSNALDRLKRELNGQNHFENTILYSPTRVYNMRKDFINQASWFSNGLDDTFRVLLEEGDLSSRTIIDEYNYAPDLNNCLYNIANELSDLFVIAEGLKKSK